MMNDLSDSENCGDNNGYNDDSVSTNDKSNNYSKKLIKITTMKIIATIMIIMAV